MKKSETLINKKTGKPIDERKLDADILKIMDKHLQVVEGNIIGNRFECNTKIRQYIHKISGTKPYYKDENKKTKINLHN